MTTSKNAVVKAKPVAPAVIVPPDPEILSVVRYDGSDPETWARPPYPWYLVSRDGFYLWKDTLLGPTLLKEGYYPEHYETLGDFKKGWFRFALPRVPADIISQALDFFRIVFRDMNSEAEVLLLFKRDTEQYALFPPYQVVGHGKVDSIYDVALIPEGFEVLGTIHSHCDFSAFHSGIDEGDARDFNGLHITIGHVNTDNPSFDAMVMINKQKFQYRLAESVAEIENDLDSLAAPDEWMNTYVHKTAIPILALDFPTLTREELDEFGKRTTHSYVPVVVTTPKTTPTYPHWDGGNNYQQTRWSDEFKKQLPREWFEKEQYPSVLKDEFYKVQLNKLLDEWFDAAAKHGLFLDANLFEMTEIGVKQLNDRSTKDVDDEDDEVTGTAADGEVIMAPNTSIN